MHPHIIILASIIIAAPMPPSLEREFGFLVRSHSAPSNLGQIPDGFRAPTLARASASTGHQGIDNSHNPHQPAGETSATGAARKFVNSL